MDPRSTHMDGWLNGPGLANVRRRPLSDINRYRVTSYVEWSRCARYPEGARVWTVSGPQAEYDNKFPTWESAYRYALAIASHPVKPMPNDFINENRCD
ncbi:hypothetical protein ACL1IP_08225 [Corynebacterium striatum]